MKTMLANIFLNDRWTIDGYYLRPHCLPLSFPELAPTAGRPHFPKHLASACILPHVCDSETALGLHQSGSTFVRMRENSTDGVRLTDVGCPLFIAESCVPKKLCPAVTSR